MIVRSRADQGTRPCDEQRCDAVPRRVRPRVTVQQQNRWTVATVSQPQRHLLELHMLQRESFEHDRPCPPQLLITP